MKQTLIAVVEKERIIPKEQIEMGQSDRNIIDLPKILKDNFLKYEDYDIKVLGYSESDNNDRLNEVLSKANKPILIGIGKAANFVEKVKYYKRKYLISPHYDKPYDILADRKVTWHDANDTYFYFGGSPEELMVAINLHKRYRHIYHKSQDLTRTIEEIGSIEFFCQLGETA